MTVDRRIRVDGEPAATEPAEFFEVRLPNLFAEAQDRLRPSSQELAPRPLTISVGNRSSSLRVDGARVDAEQLDAHRLQPGLDLPVVDLATETGDVTVHCSCTLHIAAPPVERERRVMYTSFSLPTIGGAEPGALRSE